MDNGLKWTRVRPGVYTSGEYLVEQTWGGEWYASGPGGVDECHSSKRDAQAVCARAAAAAARCPRK